MVTKAEIEKAKKRYWLMEAQKQVGSHIKSLDEVKIISKSKKPRYSLGKTLAMKAKRKPSSYYKKK